MCSCEVSLANHLFLNLSNGSGSVRSIQGCTWHHGKDNSIMFPFPYISASIVWPWISSFEKSIASVLRFKNEMGPYILTLIMFNTELPSKSMPVQLHFSYLSCPLAFSSYTVFLCTSFHFCFCFFACDLYSLHYLFLFWQCSRMMLLSICLLLSN